MKLMQRSLCGVLFLERRTVDHYRKMVAILYTTFSTAFSTAFVSKGLISNNPALVQIMVRCRTGLWAKQTSPTPMTTSLTHSITTTSGQALAWAFLAKGFTSNSRTDPQSMCDEKQPYPSSRSTKNWTSRQTLQTNANSPVLTGYKAFQLRWKINHCWRRP